MNLKRAELKHKNLYLTPETMATLMALSRRKNVSANQIINQALEQFLKQARQRKLLEDV